MKKNNITILTYIHKNEMNAGPKAPSDIISFLSKKYKINNFTISVNKNNKKEMKNAKYKKILYIIKARLLNQITIIQHPFSKNSFIKILNKNKTIVLIHDIDILRNGENDNNKNEISILNNFKYIIVHNNKMKDYLIKKGVNKQKLFVLEIFDYKVFGKNNINKECQDKEIVYAGNINKKKTPFIYEINYDKINFKFNIYGNYKDDITNKNIYYKGQFLPEELPNKIVGKYGLIWDGRLRENDKAKNYTKYNTPHKLSCYICAEIPVIVWNDAAISEIVKKYDIGYCIDNLYEINNIDESQYFIKRNNIINLSEKVENGDFILNVIDKIVNIINGGRNIEKKYNDCN